MRLRLLALLMLLLPAIARAQTPESAPATTAPSLPQAISSLLSITYACQAVSGVELYHQADDMARKLVLRVTGDANATTQFMKRAEDQARTNCPNTDACWRELMDENQPMTMENAKAACARLSGQAAQTVADSYQALTGPKN